MQDHLTALSLRFTMRLGISGVPATPGVYLIRNIISGKVYVGSTTKSLRNRRRQHISDLVRQKHHNAHLQRAWSRDGADAFVFEILNLCEADECIKLEQAAIDEFRSAEMVYGYNFCPLAGTARGYKHTEQTKAKIVAAHARPEVKALRAKIMADPEYKARHAVSMREVLNTPEYRARMSRSVRAALSRPGVREKISEGVRRALDERPEIREKLAAVWKGRKHTDATKAKMAAYQAQPEVKAKNRTVHVGKVLSAETRAKIGAANAKPTDETRVKKAAGAKKGWLKRVLHSPPQRLKSCSVEGCEMKCATRGLCSMHYQRVRAEERGHW